MVISRLRGAAIRQDCCGEGRVGFPGIAAGWAVIRDGDFALASCSRSPRSGNGGGSCCPAVAGSRLRPGHWLRKVAGEGWGVWRW